MSRREKALIYFCLLVSLLCAMIAVTIKVKATEGDYLGLWGFNPSNLNPYGITTDNTNIWVVEYDDDLMFKYDMDGVYIGVWGLHALNGASRGITTDGTYIWVADASDHAVYKYNMVGGFIEVWVMNGLNWASIGIATDGTNIWITDLVDTAVYKYDMGGVYIGVWDLHASNADPRDITTDGTNIWVVNYVSDSVLKYDMDGVYIDVWVTTGLNAAPVGITTNGTHIWITDLIYDVAFVYEGVFAVYGTPNIPTSLYGAGFNDSISYVELHWYHDMVDVGFFEVQNSTDGIVWDVLGYSTSTQYIDYQVVNGTERYYQIRACKEQPDGWHNSSFTDIDFETVYFVWVKPYLSGDWINYNVSSVHVIKGTYISGDLASMEYDDADYYRVDEVTGVEGFDIRFNFTDVPDTILSLSHRILCEYEGNPAHDVDIEVFNFTSNAWVDSIHVPEHGFRWLNNSMSLNSIDFNDGGNVWLRIVHHTSGVKTHYQNIDYFQLRGFIPVSAGGGGLIWWIGAIFISIPIFLVLAYILRRK